MKEEFRNLTDIGTEAVQASIVEYAHWFVISAICWLAFGALLIAVGIYLYRVHKQWIAALALLFFGLITIPINVPTLIKPKAYAIHQLLKDATGKSN